MKKSLLHILFATMFVVFMCCQSNQTPNAENVIIVGSLGTKVLLNSVSLNENGILLVGKEGGIITSFSMDDTLAAIQDYRVNCEYIGKPVANNESILVPGDNGLYCFDLNGELRWSRSFSDRIKTEVKFMGERVYAHIRGEGIYCLDIANGTLIWEFKSDEGTIGGLYINDGIVLVSGLGRLILGLDGKDGSVVWKHEMPHGTIISEGVVEGNFLASNNCSLENEDSSFISVIDIRTGAMSLKAPANTNCRYRPLIQDSVLYTTTEDSRILAFNYRSREKIWSVLLDGDVAATHLISDGQNIYFGSINRRIYKIDKSNGFITKTTSLEYGTSELFLYGNFVYFLMGNGDVVKYG